MNEELRNLLERIFVKTRSADRPNQTILSLTKRDGELLVAAFNLRVVGDAPPRQQSLAEAIADR